METKGSLASALAKAQSEITDAAKDGYNPHFDSSFSTLTAVWDACREPLTKNGLSVVQGTKLSTEGRILLVTTLLHSSGERIESELPLIIGKQDMQGLGSALTYARRYALAALVGVSSDEDMDAEDIKAQPKPEPQRERPPTAQAQSEPKLPSVASMSKDELATFIIPFGKKYKGKRLCDIDYGELAGYADWMAAQIQSDKNAKKTPNPSGLRVFEIVDRWLSAEK